MARLHSPSLSCLWVVAGVALIAVASYQVQAAELPVQTPILAIAQADHAPSVDGVLDDDVWEKAAGLIRLIPIATGDISPHDTAVLVCYTRERLYLAYECHFDASANLQGNARPRDEGSPWTEDSVEVFLSPNRQEPEDYYQIILNSAGSIYDMHRGDMTWNADIEYEVGTADGIWVAEMSIPFPDLGVDTPAPGEAWLVNLCRDAVAGGGVFEAWTQVKGGYADFARFGELRFAGKTPVVRINSLGSPRHGRLAVDARAINHSDRQATITLHASIRKPGTEPAKTGEAGVPSTEGKLVTASDQAVVEPGHIQKLNFTTKFTDDELGRMNLTATLGDGTVLYTQQFPLQVRPATTLTVEPVPIRQHLILTISGAYEDHVDPNAAKAMVTVHRVDGDQEVTQTTVPLAAAEAGTSLDYSEWPEGNYRLAVEITHEGQPIGSAEATFEKTPTPEWVNNDLGKSRVIVPPYTPMAYDDTAIRCWGRTMDFDGLLPSNMISQGEELLSAPMTLQIGLGAEIVAFSPSGTVDFAEQSQDRAELTTRGSAAGVDAQIDWWMEYDGFTWGELTLDTSETVEHLSIEIPLGAEVAEMTHGTPNGRHCAFNELLTGQDLHWDFLPTIWVGNHDRGLCWFAESDQYYNPASSDRVVQLIPRDDGYLLRINIIGQPTEIPGDFTIGFGLLGSPVKKLPKGWSTLVITGWPLRRSVLDWEKLGTKPDWGIIWNHNHLTAPLHVPEIVGELATKGHEQNVGIIHYIDPGTHSLAYEEPQRYHAEWRREPSATFYIDKYDETYPRLCLNSSYADYLLAGINYMVSEFGLEGIYHDGGAPAWCSNAIHGCGYEDAEGRMHRTRPIRAYRQYHKRLATMLYHDNGIQDFLIYNHTSDICFLPVLTFVNTHLDGEQYKGHLRRGANYLELLSLKEVRPQYVSTQWGIPTVFLNICQHEGEGSAECSSTFLSYMLPHGVPFFGTYLYRQYNEDIHRLYGNFDIDNATFHPYWHSLEGFAADAEPDATLISCHTYPEKERLLVVAGNVTDTSHTTSVTIDPQALGLAQNMQIRRNVSYDVRAELEGDILTMHLPPHGFALIWLE